MRNEVILHVEWDRRLAEWSRLRLIGEVRVDDDRFADGVTFQIPETSERRSVLGLGEGFVTLGRTPVEVTLGQQIFT